MVHQEPVYQHCSLYIRLEEGHTVIYVFQTSTEILPVALLSSSINFLGGLFFRSGVDEDNVASSPGAMELVSELIAPSSVSASCNSNTLLLAAMGFILAARVFSSMGESSGPRPFSGSSSSAISPPATNSSRVPLNFRSPYVRQHRPGHQW